MNHLRISSSLLLLLAAVTASAMRTTQDELVNFGTTGVNEEVRKNVQFNGLPNGVRYEVKERLSKEFKVENENNLTTQFGRLEVGLSFRPRQAREYRDTLVLVPRSNPNADTLIVFVQGIGVSQTIEREITFDTILTHDRAIRAIAVRPQYIERAKFKMIDGPKPPFFGKLDTIKVSGDTAVIGTLAFDSPIAGEFNDRIMIVRVDENDDSPFDTLTIRLQGKAVEMECMRDAVCTPTTVMQTSNASTERRYNINAPFRFDVVLKDPSQPFTAEVEQREPTQEQVKVNVSFRPTTVGRFSTLATLRRWRKEPGGNETLSETCDFLISGESKPRPVRFTAELVPQERTVNVGDTVGLAIRVRTDDPFDAPVQLSAVTASFSYDPSVLVPLLGANDTRAIENDTAIMTVRTPYASTINADGDTIMLIRAVAVLGSSDRCVVGSEEVITATMNGQQRQFECNDALITLGSVWTHNGGVRLVNSLKGPLTVQASPNPVTESTVITVENVRAGSGTLRVFDATGTVVADFTAEVRAGATSVTWNTTGVLPGVYFIRLANGDAAGQTLHMAVRTVIVQ
jgi:hypothetical protein